MKFCVMLICLLFGTLGSTATGYKLLPSDSDSLELPPPDYNDVVNTPPGAAVVQPPSPRQKGGTASSQPSAPPLSELELAAAENPPPPPQPVAAASRQRQHGGTNTTDYGTGGIPVFSLPDLLYNMKKEQFGEDGRGMKHPPCFLYRHKHRADHVYHTVHYYIHTTSYIQQIKKIPNVSYSHSWSHNA